MLFLDYVELDTPRFHSTFRLLEVHELDQARRDEIAHASLAELEARWTRLAKDHHW